MKKAIGIIFIVSGIALGIYVGVWCCLILGIVGLIDLFRYNQPATTLHIVSLIVKILFSETFGVLSGILPVFLGLFLMSDD